MPRSIHFKCLIASLLSGFTVCCVLAELRPLPNILWISCEDIGPRLGCYGDPQATTPALDTLAKQGVRFTRAFTCHGVCAPSRTGIITGVDPIHLGANHMRSKAHLPPQVRCFPALLREHGYYTCNNQKTDYNFHWDKSAVWDESSGKAHWRKRPDPEQPFFAVFNLGVTHESGVWPENHARRTRELAADQRHAPDEVSVPPIYPDTPEVRGAIARLADLITVMDQQVAKRLRELEEDGLAESTIVFFWSDHGDGFPRAKRTLYGTGTHVPLIVRIPEPLRQPSQGSPSSVDERLISLIDLGPTVLNLAGVRVPEHMQGRAFLGANLPQPRKYVYQARDRIDERTDLVRAVRDDRFRYVRSYITWRPGLPYVKYAEKSVIRQALRQAAAEGSLPKAAKNFMQPRREFEALYDLTADPFETRNLVNDAQYASHLRRLRAECDAWMLRVRDVHLIPEPLLAAEEQRAGNRQAILQQPGGQKRLQRLMQVAAWAARGQPADTPALQAAVEDTDPAVRWWALLGLANIKDLPSVLPDAVEHALTDKEPTVRLAAARLLARPDHLESALSELEAGLRRADPMLRHLAMEMVADIGSEAAPLRGAVQTLLQNEKKRHVKDVAAQWLSELGEKPPGG